MYRNFVKRIFDFCFAFFGLLFLSPIFIVLTISLLIVNRGTPFFLQRRPGRNEMLFTIIKFKTMHDGCDASGELLPDAERLTTVGRFIRKSSLDEIPQLLNVLKGDMSIVGPRPLLEAYLPLYNATQKRRHEVRPGITGWAQVNGRNGIKWDIKLQYDVWYVTHLSFLLDCNILYLTLLKVLKREGISQEGHATAEAFKGN
ncbi:lipid carrier--UDP-N-acetylgalactosaminyltransferase [Flavobacterium sp. LMO8]|uniref:sugar transferase n=1 Tax=Flavobacterium sp. LMO8 TaxID=2654244 RepID=UPI001291A9BC|nr:sugar transferase [Flavobacterium sp. LMO8]MQP24737.1 lipid carrier--UDP-N-acetylgalactosaminyltransferase [Flavobacterium sp. LMO8]